MLEDYKNIVGAAAGFVTYCQVFSGVFVCVDIYKRGSTEKVPVLPFLGGFVMSVLFYQFALIINDPVMNVVNTGSIALNFCYLVFYYLWTSKGQQNGFFKELCKGIFVICLLLSYVRFEDPKKVEFRFGFIVNTLLMILISSPLFYLGEIIRTKSTERLPFPMIISGFMCSALWLLYGIIIKNYSIISQNVMTSILGLIQLSLFVIFPRNVKTEKTKKS